MSNEQVNLLSKLVFESYVNEVCLDYALKEKFLSSEKIGNSFPIYKVIKMYPLLKRYGLSMQVFLWLSKFLIVPVVFCLSFLNIIFALLFFISPLRRDISALPEEVLFSNDNNFKLFRYLYDDFDERVHFVCKRQISGLRYLSARDFLVSFYVVINVLYKIILFENTEEVRRGDLVFHVIDLLTIVWFSVFSYKLVVEEGRNIITDCNLQRWSYVLTHLSSQCSVIQHAYIHEDIKFNYPFGNIRCLYVFDSKFKDIFSVYYNVVSIKKIRPNILLDEFESLKPLLFLASSAPYIDSELSFLKSIRKSHDYFIVLKLHPRHVYDSKVLELKALSDRVVGSNVFPNSEYMVSYDSFLGYEYKAMGKKVVFLKDNNVKDYFHF